MENITLARAVEVVRALGPAEQLQLRVLMDSWQTLPPQVPPPTEATPEQEQAFLQHLLAKGVISQIPTGKRLDSEPPPIVVQGEPVSETIIRERR